MRPGGGAARARNLPGGPAGPGWRAASLTASRSSRAASRLPWPDPGAFSGPARAPRPGPIRRPRSSPGRSFTSSWGEFRLVHGPSSCWAPVATSGGPAEPGATRSCSRSGVRPTSSSGPARGRAVSRRRPRCSRQAGHPGTGETAVTLHARAARAPHRARRAGNSMPGDGGDERAHRGALARRRPTSSLTALRRPAASEVACGILASR